MIHVIELIEALTAKEKSYVILEYIIKHLWEIHNVLDHKEKARVNKIMKKAWKKMEKMEKRRKWGK